MLRPTPAVNYSNIVRKYLNQVKVKAIQEYMPNFIEKLNDPTKELDVLSAYFLVDSCPQLFTLLSGNYSYMHYTDFKYSTLDSAFPKT